MRREPDPSCGSTTVPGAEALAVEAGEPGCASLGVVDAAGERTEIEG